MNINKKELEKFLEYLQDKIEDCYKKDSQGQGSLENLTLQLPPHWSRGGRHSSKLSPHSFEAKKIPNFFFLSVFQILASFCKSWRILFYRSPSFSFTKKYRDLVLLGPRGQMRCSCTLSIGFHSCVPAAAIWLCVYFGQEQGVSPGQKVKLSLRFKTFSFKTKWRNFLCIL